MRTKQCAATRVAPSAALKNRRRLDKTTLTATTEFSQDRLVPVERLRFARDITRLHGLGPRPVGEFILEIVAKWPARQRKAFLDRLARYAALNPALVRDVGADLWPTPALVQVPA